MSRSVSADIAVETHRFDGDDRFPNSRLPVVIYRQAIPADTGEVEAILRRNRWAAAWRADIGFYPFDHFHSNAHELVAIMAGEAHGRLGGPGNGTVVLRAGDAVLIPAGVCHFGVYSSPDIATIGAYPAGAPSPDLRRGDPAEYAQAAGNAARTPVPSSDPILGSDGPLVRLWAA